MLEYVNEGVVFKKYFASKEEEAEHELHNLNSFDIAKSRDKSDTNHSIPIAGFHCKGQDPYSNSQIEPQSRFSKLATDIQEEPEEDENSNNTSQQAYNGDADG